MDLGSAPGGLRFVIKESGGRDLWFDNYGADFVVPLPEQAVSTSLTGVRQQRAGCHRETPPEPPAGATGASMEAAQMALGGAAAVTFSGLKTNVDASIEEAIKEAAIAMEAAKIARRLPSRPPPRQRICPRDAGASTKARGSSLRRTPLPSALPSPRVPPKLRPSAQRLRRMHPSTTSAAPPPRPT